MKRIAVAKYKFSTITIVNREKPFNTDTRFFKFQKIIKMSAPVGADYILVIQKHANIFSAVCGTEI